MFPPGRAKLATSPVPTGSAADGMTMGIVLVAFFAAWITGVAPATMRATFRRTNSSANAGRRSMLPAAQRYSIEMLCPSTHPRSRSPRINASSRRPGWEASDR
jgi:hypothetical protein